MEVFEALDAELASSGEQVQYTYAMALAKQAPIMEMCMRGILIDERSRQDAIKELDKILRALDGRFQRIMREVFGHELNWDSPAQLKTLFYGQLRIKEIKKRNQKGQYVATVDEAALNKLQLHFYAQPLAKYVLALREIRKKIGFLKTEIDPDKRIRSSLNIAGTNTGRLSSSMNDFGTGTNLQNVDNTLRYPMIADPRMYLVNIDLEQADARNVGAIMWNTFLESHGAEEAGRYLDACDSGDLHTTVCRMAWNELEWPEERSGWRAVADQIAYRGLTFRDMAKKLGHGTNYLGTPRTMAGHTQTPTKTIEDFQRRYFSAFPLIPEWHKHVINEVRTTGIVTTIYGRRRTFFGRGDDASTHRKAVAYAPQSMTGHQIDMGMLNLWRHMPEAQLLIQVHDSILLQVPFHNHQTHVERALHLLEYRRELKGGREFFVPLEALCGWNWGKATPANPLGVAKWKGSESRVPPVARRIKDYL